MNQVFLVVALMICGLVLPTFVDHVWLSSGVGTGTSAEIKSQVEDIFQYRGYNIEKIETGYISRELGIAASDAGSLCRSISILIYRAATGIVDEELEKMYLKADLDRDLVMSREEISLFARSAGSVNRERYTNGLLLFWGTKG